MCRRAGKYCCPFSLSASGRTSRRPQLKVFWPQQSLNQINIHFHLGATFQSNLPPHLSPFFLLGSNPPSAVPGLLVTIPSFTCRDRRILSPWCSFVFVPSRPLGHQEIAQTIRAESLKNIAPSFGSCFFHDSPEIHSNIFWTQQVFQFFNFHFHAVTFFQVLFRSCNDRSFSRAPSMAIFLWMTAHVQGNWWATTLNGTCHEPEEK